MKARQSDKLMYYLGKGASVGEVSTLLKRGADPNYDDGKLTPLMKLIKSSKPSRDRNSQRSLAQLLSHGADPDTMIKGMTPLMAIALMRPSKLQRELIVIMMAGRASTGLKYKGLTAEDMYQGSDWPQLSLIGKRALAKRTIAYGKSLIAQIKRDAVIHEPNVFKKKLVSLIAKYVTPPMGT